MNKHRVSRVYVGPATKEILLNINRAYFVQNELGQSSVTIEVKRRLHKIDKNPPYLSWTAYAISESGKANFQMPFDFINDPVKYPRGFYDAKLLIDCCEVADFQIVKAPSYNIAYMNFIEDSCARNDDWVEPECAPTDIPEQDSCGIINTDYCEENKKVVVQKINIAEGYIY